MKPTWQELTHALGLILVLVIAVVYAAGFHRDSAVTIALLGVATTLIGAGAGWELIRKNGKGRDS